MTYLPVRPYPPDERLDQPSAGSAFFRSKWVWLLPLALLLLTWRYGIARDVLIINRYSQTFSVRVAGIPCGSVVPADSHRFALLPFCFPRSDTPVAVYGVDGSLLKSQNVDLTRKQNHYDNLLLLDIKP